MKLPMVFMMREDANHDIPTLAVQAEYYQEPPVKDQYLFSGPGTA